MAKQCVCTKANSLVDDFVGLSDTLALRLVVFDGFLPSTFGFGIKVTVGKGEAVHGAVSVGPYGMQGGAEVLLTVKGCHLRSKLLCGHLI